MEVPYFASAEGFCPSYDISQAEAKCYTASRHGFHSSTSLFHHIIPNHSPNRVFFVGFSGLPRRSSGPGKLYSNPGFGGFLGEICKPLDCAGAIGNERSVLAGSSQPGNPPIREQPGTPIGWVKSAARSCTFSGFPIGQVEPPNGVVTLPARLYY